MQETHTDCVGEDRILPSLLPVGRRLRFTPEFEARLRQLYIRVMVEPVPSRLLAIVRPPCDDKT